MASSVEAHGGAPTPEARRDARTRRWQRFWDGASVILGSRVAVIGLSMVLFWVAVAIVAPVISPHNPTAQDSSEKNATAGSHSPTTWSIPNRHSARNTSPVSGSNG